MTKDKSPGNPAAARDNIQRRETGPEPKRRLSSTIHKRTIGATIFQNWRQKYTPGCQTLAFSLLLPQNSKVIFHRPGKAPQQPVEVRFPTIAPSFITSCCRVVTACFIHGYIKQCLFFYP